MEIVDLHCEEELYYWILAKYRVSANNTQEPGDGGEMVEYGGGGGGGGRVYLYSVFSVTWYDT